MTRIFGTNKEEILEAAKIIQEGGLVAFPTETVYGLGADALNPEAVNKVYAAKGRPSDNPMIVHIAQKEDLFKLTQQITPDMELLIEKFWPGPLTMVVPAKEVIPRVTTGGLDTVAIRMPKDQIALQLIMASETPIAAPSANLSGRPSPTTANHVYEDLNGRIDGLIKGDNCQIGIESTVLDMTGEIPMILRPGMITLEELSMALGKEVTLDPTLLKNSAAQTDGALELNAEYQPKSPGMKYKHYAPTAEMIIYRGDPEKVRLALAEEKMKRLEAGDKVEILIFDDEHPEIAAREFFARLRACDKAGVDVIFAMALKEEGIGFSVMNRMFKSAGYHVVEVE